MSSPSDDSKLFPTLLGMLCAPQARRVNVGTHIYNASLNVVCAPYAKLSRKMSHAASLYKWSSHSTLPKNCRRDLCIPYSAATLIRFFREVRALPLASNNNTEAGFSTIIFIQAAKDTGSSFLLALKAHKRVCSGLVHSKYSTAVSGLILFLFLLLSRVSSIPIYWFKKRLRHR